MTDGCSGRPRTPAAPRCSFRAIPSAATWRTRREGIERVGLPPEWQEGGGAEIGDLIGYNGWLYVFFFTRNPDPAKYGFWCARVKKMNGHWRWKLIVGDADGALYPAGLGVPDNGVAVPFRFRDAVTWAPWTVRPSAPSTAWRHRRGRRGAPPACSCGASTSATAGRESCRRAGLDGDAERAARGLRKPEQQVPLAASGPLTAASTWARFDVGTGLQVLTPPKAPPIALPDPAGFDLYSTRDGKTWRLETAGWFRRPLELRGTVVCHRPGDGRPLPRHGEPVLRLPGVEEAGSLALDDRAPGARGACAKACPPR